MATIFRNLFRHKKTASKDETPEVTNDMDSRRSLRLSKNRATRFADDNMLPATAAYHTNNTAPKMKKGPQSCPGGYGEEYEVDGHQSTSGGKRSTSRHYNGPSSSSGGASSSVAAMYSQVNKKSKSRYGAQVADPFYSRWETSEYGSENTSPIHHRHHYDPHLDQEEEEYQYEQDSKQRYRRQIEEKLNDYEHRRREDRRRIKDLEKEKQTIEKEKNDVVKIMIQQNDKLEKEKKKVDYYKRKYLEMEQQMNHMRNHGFGSFGMFPTTPHHHHHQQPQQMFPSFGSSASSGPSQRFSFMSSSIRPISSSNTPTTSAMDTTCGGAGESLVPASDLSLVQIPPMPSLHVDLPANVPTGGPIGGSNMFHDDEEDETKNFRTTETPASSIEMPRVSSMSFLNDSSNLSTLAEVKDEGYSTTATTTPEMIVKEL